LRLRGAGSEIERSYQAERKQADTSIQDRMQQGCCIRAYMGEAERL